MKWSIIKSDAEYHDAHERLDEIFQSNDALEQDGVD